VVDSLALEAMIKLVDEVLKNAYALKLTNALLEGQYRVVLTHDAVLSFFCLLSVGRLIIQLFARFAPKTDLLWTVITMTVAAVLFRIWIVTSCVIFEVLHDRLTPFGAFWTVLLPLWTHTIGLVKTIDKIFSSAVEEQEDNMLDVSFVSEEDD
jgi:hypothetical protein